MNTKDVFIFCSMGYVHTTNTFEYMHTKTKVVVVSEIGKIKCQVTYDSRTIGHECRYKYIET